MAESDPELDAARARLERARKQYENKRTAKRKRERRRDTRSKVLLGAWLRDVALPDAQANNEDISFIEDGVGRMIADQAHKTVASRQGDIDELRPVFGDDWAQRWKQHIDAGGE